jgi:hypothetical protein
VLRRRDRPLAELGERLVVEVEEFLLLEVRPCRQRNVAVLGRVAAGEGVTVAGGEATDVDGAGDPVGSRVDRGVGDRRTGGVPDEHHLATGPVHGVDRRDHRVDVIAQGDLGPVGVPRFQTGQRERVRAVPGPLEGGHDLLPGRAVEPETGNQDDVHARRVPSGCGGGYGETRRLRSTTLV